MCFMSLLALLAKERSVSIYKLVYKKKLNLNLNSIFILLFSLAMKQAAT